MNNSISFRLEYWEGDENNVPEFTCAHACSTGIQVQIERINPCVYKLRITRNTKTFNKISIHLQAACTNLTVYKYETKFMGPNPYRK